MWASIAGLAAITGVAGGGLLADARSRRWIFLANVPLGAIALALVPVLLPRTEQARGLGASTSRPSRSRPSGSARQCSSSAPSTTPRPPLSGPHRPPQTAVVALVALAMRQRRAQDPLVPVGAAPRPLRARRQPRRLPIRRPDAGRLSPAHPRDAGRPRVLDDPGRPRPRRGPRRQRRELAHRRARGSLSRAPGWCWRRHGHDGGRVRQLRSDRRRLGLRHHAPSRPRRAGAGDPAALRLERGDRSRTDPERAHGGVGSDC